MAHRQLVVRNSRLDPKGPPVVVFDDPSTIQVVIVEIVGGREEPVFQGEEFNSGTVGAAKAIYQQQEAHLRAIEGLRDPRCHREPRR